MTEHDASNRSLHPLKPVLIITYHYQPENVPSVMRVQWFNKHLPASGYSVQVLSASTTAWSIRPGQEVPERGVCRTPASRWQKKLLHYTNIFTTIVTHRCQASDYGLGWLPWGLAAAHRVLAKHPTCVVVSSSPSIVSHLVALALKKRHGVRWIADFQDPLVGNPSIKANRLGNVWNSKVEHAIFERADRLVANTDTVAEMWRQRYPQWSGKFAVIWNGYDGDEPCPLPRPTSREHRVLAHVGSLYLPRHPGALLDSVQRLAASGQWDEHRVKLRLVGPFDSQAALDPAQIRALVEQGRLEIRNERVPRQVALQETADSDYLLLLDASTALQVPCKIYDYLRTGRPILAFTTRNSPVERILARSGVRHLCLCDGSTPREVDEGLVAFLAQPTDPTTPAPWFRETFEARALARALADLIHSIDR